MKFHIPRANVIESDAGFSVEVCGRTGLIYREGNKELRIDSEVLVGPSGMVIYSNSIRKWQPNGQAVSPSEKQQIIQNVRDAFAFRGFDIEVE